MAQFTNWKFSFLKTLWKILLEEVWKLLNFLYSLFGVSWKKLLVIFCAPLYDFIVRFCDLFVHKSLTKMLDKSFLTFFIKNIKNIFFWIIFRVCLSQIQFLHAIVKKQILMKNISLVDWWRKKLIAFDNSCSFFHVLFLLIYKWIQFSLNFPGYKIFFSNLLEGISNGF